MLAPTLRNRLFLTLVLVALIPVGATLLVGTLSLREIVVSAGSAGAWDEVAESGRRLLEQVEDLPPETSSPELAQAAERHRTHLTESVRFSRLFTYLGERALALLPVAALLLLLFVAALALWAANRLSRSFSGPVEELVGWSRLLGVGRALPPEDPEEAGREIREFQLLRQALRQTADELTESRRREVEQARTQSWAEMARRVAHELKNPLTPMRMAADRVAASSDRSTAAAGEVLIEEIGRLDELARTFAQFGRPPEGPMAQVDLQELLLGLAHRLEQGNASLALSLPPEPVFVRGHVDTLERVIRNLIANALEAVPPSEDGAPPPPIEVILDRLPTGAGITVRDRGTGIRDELLPRIWEPEFTTKRRGTGLGLPLVRQAVRAHGGEVSAENHPEGGAVFRIQLPYDPDGEGGE